MVGTISVAPSRETIASFKFGAEHCGNVDCREITVGNTLLLPVNTEGALFGLGDVHAVQGDGEISCVAVEVSAVVTVRLDLIPREESPLLACPQVNGPDFIGSLGCHFGNSIETNIKYAYHDLIRRLDLYYDFTPMDAYHLLSQTGRVRVCQVLGDFQAALASVERRYLG
jgi:amidase